MRRYRYLAGFWLSVAAGLWALMAIGGGLNAIANDPERYVNDVMIPTLVLLAGLAFWFTRLALRFRRKGNLFAKAS